MTTDKPTTITAAEFVQKGYAKLIAEDKCVVRDPSDDNVVNSIVQEWRGCYAYTYECRDGEEWGCHADNTFTVEWLPETAQVSEPAPVAGSAGDAKPVNELFGVKELPLHWIKMYRDQIAEGWNKDGQSNNVLDLADLAEVLQAELTTVRSQLAASQAEAGKLKVALETNRVEGWRLMIYQWDDPDQWVAEYIESPNRRIKRRKHIGGLSASTISETVASARKALEAALADSK